MRKRKWRQVVAVVLLGCATSIAVGQNPWRVGSLMGGEVRGETSTGVPWSWLSLRMWGQAHRFGMKEWGVGVSHGGWRAWNQTALLCGGQHRSTQKRSSFEWLLTSSLVRWPDVSRKAGHARLECAGSQHHPWGIVRMQAHVEWGQTRRDHPLRWSVQSRMGERMVGCQYQAERLRVHVWAGQGPEGLWTHARHVEASWVGKSDGHWSAYVLDGQAPWGGAYVALPALDARQWSRAPDSGLQMGLRYRSSKNALSPSDWEWKGAWQFSWAPSQQETFRCAWRIRWEA